MRLMMPSTLLCQLFVVSILILRIFSCYFFRFPVLVHNMYTNDIIASDVLSRVLWESTMNRRPSLRLGKMIYEQITQAVKLNRVRSCNHARRRRARELDMLHLNWNPDDWSQRESEKKILFFLFIQLLSLLHRPRDFTSLARALRRFIRKSVKRLNGVVTFKKKRAK